MSPRTPDQPDSATLFVAEGETSLSARPYVIGATVAVIAWIIAAWFSASSYTLWQAREAKQRAERELASTLDDIARGMERTLHLFHGIPSAIGRDENVKDALRHYSGHPLTKKDRPREDRRDRLAAEPKLAALNRSLDASARDFHSLSVLWIMDANGMAIAASNAGSPESFVGTDYGDRFYFSEAMHGRFGKQFAVGRRTNIPGLFFSSPVVDGKQVIGVAASKINLADLAHWVNQANAFVTDKYGVIIQAQNKSYEMRTLPRSDVVALSETERLERYKQRSFSELAITSWPNPDFPDLSRLEGAKAPVIIASRSIPDEQLSVTVIREVPEVASLSDDFSTRFVLSAVLGALLVSLSASILFYIAHWQNSRRQRSYRAHIDYLASHDSLTGLFSRSVVTPLMALGIALAQRTHRRFGVLFVDLDLFKDINDSLGHETGDKVLQLVAQRLSATVRQADAVIRQGGDEFVILLNDLDTPEDAAHLASKILDTLRQPMLLSATPLTISASIGIALYPEDGDNASLLLRHADVALYSAKESGRRDYCFFHADMTAETLDRLSLDHELRVALEERQLELYYQPQYCISEQTIIGCEALLRWPHPTRGMISPDKVIPLAEKAGLIVPLGRWVLEEACRQACSWRQELERDMTVSVNLSALQFRKNDLVETVRTVLAETGLPARCLELEITENILMDDSQHTLETMRALKALGVRLAIDDFGTGYSSLAYLKRFDADSLKIDQTFVRDMESDANDWAIIKAIINLADSLDYHVIAEGVESERQAKLLAELGCDHIQGYWTCRPVPAQECLAVLRQPPAPMAQIS